MLTHHALPSLLQLGSLGPSALRGDLGKGCVKFCWQPRFPGLGVTYFWPIWVWGHWGQFQYGDGDFWGLSA